MREIISSLDIGSSTIKLVVGEIYDNDLNQRLFNENNTFGTIYDDKGYKNAEVELLQRDDLANEGQQIVDCESVDEPSHWGLAVDGVLSVPDEIMVGASVACAVAVQEALTK